MEGWVGSFVVVRKVSSWHWEQRLCDEISRSLTFSLTRPQEALPVFQMCSDCRTRDCRDLPPHLCLDLCLRDSLMEEWTSQVTALQGCCDSLGLLVPVIEGVHLWGVTELSESCRSWELRTSALSGKAQPNPDCLYLSDSDYAEPNSWVSSWMWNRSGKYDASCRREGFCWPFGFSCYKTNNGQKHLTYIYPCFPGPGNVFSAIFIFLRI